MMRWAQRSHRSRGESTSGTGCRATRWRAVPFLGALAASWVATLLLAAAAAAAPDPDLWDRWTVHDPASKTTISHAAWDHFLKTYVVVGDDGIARVAYRWVTATDAQRLDDYIDRLGSVSISRFSPAEQRAFWINLYNALIVRLVLQHYPVESILDIDLSGGFIDSLFGDGPWERKLLTVEDAELSLNDIENRILRPIWTDPRIHYALNRAALGSPNLQSDAFTAANTDRLLEAAARAYVNHPRGVHIVDDELIVSSLYVDYEDDFGGDEVSIIAHLRRYAGAELSRALIGRTDIEDDEYDWALNDMR